MPGVRLESISKAYGDAIAVEAVSLDVAAGEFVTLLGPSGCGKTTTLRAIAGLVAPDSGTVRIGDVDVTRVPVHERNIGMVFQSHALFPHMTVDENVAFGLRMRGVARTEQRERVRSALASVQLDAFGTRHPHQLSGGQQQRVALARALVTSPQVLLLDEPFGALDRKLREAMQVELRQLTRRLGMTAVFVTHDQQEALVMSDRIAVMNAGRIEQVGPPDSIFERPATRFVADFMGVGNLLDCRVDSMSTDGVRLVAGGLAFDAASTLPLRAGERVTAAIRGERIRLDDDAGAPPGGSFDATIEQAIYSGTTTGCRVRLTASPGTVLAVAHPSPRRDAAGMPLRDGTRVRVSWDPAAVHLIREERP